MEADKGHTSGVASADKAPSGRLASTKDASEATPATCSMCCAKEDDGSPCKDETVGDTYYCSWHMVNH